MEHVFSIVMFALGGGILLYAGLVSVSGYDAIPRGYATKVKNKKAYAKRFAKLLALIALPFLAAGLVGLLSPWFGGVTVAVGLGLIVHYGNKITRITDELDMGGNNDGDDE